MTHIRAIYYLKKYYPQKYQKVYRRFNILKILFYIKFFNIRYMSINIKEYYYTNKKKISK